MKKPFSNKKHKILLLTFAFLIFTFAFSLVSCNTTEPHVDKTPPETVKDTITIQVTQTTHRSITLKVKSTFNKPAKSIELYRRRENKDTLVESYTAFTLEKEIIDDDSGKGLIIDTEYKYFAVRVDTANKQIDTSEIISAKTLPPTSHDYTWQEFTIGDEGNSNVLYDVWGTDENNVYAVGNITINDTTYSVIHWDGHTWQPSRKSGILSAVYGFSKEDIWAVGTSVNHYDGTIWHRIDNDDVVLHDNKEYTCIWGTSSKNLYLGNAWGKIVHWDGKKAEIEYKSTTSIPFTDIYGISENFIIAIGSALSYPSIGVIKMGNIWSNLEGLNLDNELLNSIYILNEKEFFIVGYNNYKWIEKWQKILTNSPAILNKIRGNSFGDIVAVGYGFSLFHFNGIDWKNYSYELNKPNSAFYGIYLTKDKIFAVGGESFDKGKIFIGTK